jgi:hypothetical protein
MRKIKDISEIEKEFFDSEIKIGKIVNRHFRHLEKLQEEIFYYYGAELYDELDERGKALYDLIEKSKMFWSPEYRSLVRAKEKLIVGIGD